MAIIRVDHSKFKGTADKFETYVTNLKKQMRSAESEVNSMSASWQGADYTQFKNQWNMVTENGSTYAEMVSALESYTKFLRFAGEKYKDAQIKALDSANSLPRW